MATYDPPFPSTLVTERRDNNESRITECQDISAATVIRVGDHELSLAEFLRYCAGSIGGPDGGVDLRRARDLFVRAGLDAIEAPTPADWLQLGLSVPPGAGRAELYGRVAGLARTLLATGVLDNAFFMHKPPGLRLRLHLTDPADRGTTGEVRESVVAWQRDGLVDRVVPGVYEPESRLFGGPLSMGYVHRLFTVDSLAWLDYHTLAIRQPGTGPAWSLSLLMLRALLDALEITGWEDLDVWDRIRVRTGRRLGAATALAEFGPVADEIRACWRRPELLRGQLGPPGVAIADAFRAAAVPLGARWRDGYFATEAAYLGPRQAAAFAAIFSWNRAGLPMLRQALLTEALATREADLT